MIRVTKVRVVGWYVGVDTGDEGACGDKSPSVAGRSEGLCGT